ncbi:MAG TPA: acetyl-CoA carboxylase biotin carboxyl carrier protein [Thermoanaerobaculia bacterium]|nr:acetyl-CoA carboxylase biotin carboxyl carrier protein [Thermoanaerobaculia bacterium]
MLTFEQIKELVELIAARGLHGMEVERSGFRLKIEGQAPVFAHAPSAAAPHPPGEAGAPGPVAPAPLPAAESVSTPAPPAGPADHILTSPIVGTFYSASSPDSPPFVSIGSPVKKGQVLCIIEAMKLMNEIESDADGVISQIFPQNAQAVEFGQPLFAIRVS